ncbi:lysophospholipid acyltransferase family protein [Facklamia miroungae]|uniref:1-acyl-sn-glycerol-3-phosphate acyltransferase n=1 Tax=Facklamia miroungae TaxID=120956 RepID=A0A1G7R2L2_9LACT|nr:1-acyl-sn-glycerol-3-phosphate acyltransferase [Facklamia miroungae]NKZ29160.1 1-acyl-sn-glycerol-3-phosphate acyltransferase [Facklamia miroungae]SDG04985.1 1-acyl-sn-glycerol-3-phosphate acyltransferase [Facklamia miroungae]
MTFYQFVFGILRFLFRIFNGKPHVIGKENIPNPDQSTFILAATHRSFWDPLYLAIELYPVPISFMSKESLFRNSLFAKILRKVYVFPVNREKPSPKAIKFAVKQLTQENLNLGIFPSGSRYSTEIKGGTAFIQRLSKKDIIPIAIQPPLDLKSFFKRQKAKIAFGPAIKYDSNLDYNKEQLGKIDQKIANAFDALDQQLDQNYSYVPAKKKN